MAPYQKTKAAHWRVETHLFSGDSTLDQMVGLGRLELPTSRLSSARSNQLSYKPLTTNFLKKDWDLSVRARRLYARCVARAQPLARVRPRRKRNEDGEIPPMQLNDPDDRWPLMFLKRSDRSKASEGSSL